MKKLILAVALVACHTPASSPAPAPSAAPSAVPVVSTHATVTIVNATEKPVTVFAAFSAVSVVKPKDWFFCHVDAGLVCSFELAAKSDWPLPLIGQGHPVHGAWLNATFSFEAPVTCNTTKAEVSVNNPAWYDILDVSLVDGFNKALRIDVSGGTTLGPVWSIYGNEKNFGVFPNGCDICTARQSPPCGMSPGRDGCKSGTQYKPDVPCQYQGSTMGGGGSYRIVYLGDMRPMGE